MAEAIISRRGGGGGGLNFQVIGGTTAPSNPKENMIWVNTSTKITSYIFSVTQPTGSAGMVWISTGTSSTVEFNALKKNAIQVYPISAKQYVSDEWTAVHAETWQNGMWSEWKLTLPITIDIWNTATSGNGNAKISNDEIILQEMWISYAQYQQVTTKRTWNVGQYKQLCAKIKSSNNSCTKVLALSTTYGASVQSGSFVVKTENDTQEAGTVLICDISSISGEYYVALGQYTSSGASNNATVFDEVWMQ